MDSPSLSLQKGFYDALIASNELKNAMGGEVRAYDRPPNNPEFPYVIISDAQILEDSDSCSPDAVEVFSDFHIYAREVGKVQAKGLAWIVRSIILAMDPNLDSWIIKLIDHQQERDMTDPDGITTHSVLTFRFLIEPTT